MSSQHDHLAYRQLASIPDNAEVPAFRPGQTSQAVNHPKPQHLPIHLDTRCRCTYCPEPSGDTPPPPPPNDIRLQREGVRLVELIKSE